MSYESGKSIPENKKEKLEERAQKEGTKPNQKKEEKNVYEAVCSTCEEKITVPFKPDPGRPTFCKECLKDYQRARARAQKEKEEKEKFSGSRQNYKEKVKDSNDGNNRQTTPKAFIPSEKPMSLSQISHIAPKKFKFQKKRPEVNLDEVRQLINSSINKKND